MKGQRLLQSLQIKTLDGGTKVEPFFVLLLLFNLKS